MSFEYTQSLTTVVKMVVRSDGQKDEIHAYTKARSKLGCSLKQLKTELSTAYGPSCVSYAKLGPGNESGTCIKGKILPPF